MRKTQPDIMSAKFCRECGTKIPEGAAFCPGCGRDISPDSVEIKVADTSKDVEHTLSEQWENSGKFQKLISLMWLAIILSGVSAILACFNVRDYYSYGKIPHFIFNLAMLGMDIWLCMAMMRRKNWARISYIVIASTATAFTLLGLKRVFADLTFAGVIDLGELLLTIYCAFLCFSEEVREAFKHSRLAKGTSAQVNKYQCIFYWVSIFILILIMVIWSVAYEGSEAWSDDSVEAMLAGSSDARDDVIQFVTEQCEAEGVDCTEEDVIEYIDNYIEENSPKSHKFSSNDVSKIVRGASRGLAKPGIALLKGLGKVLVALFVLVGAFLSKKKKRS